jgi:hypothetical protein
MAERAREKARIKLIREGGKKQVAHEEGSLAGDKGYSNGFDVHNDGRGERTDKKAKGKIKPRSSKRAGEEREYLRRREKYLLMHPECECCGGEATELHHKAGRIGKLLINVMYFMAVCRECHVWIEQNPLEAKEQGYSINRLTV